MANYTEEKEREYQNAVVEMMKDERGLDYTYLGNFQYERGESARSDGIKNGNVIVGELRPYLKDAGNTQLQIIWKIIVPRWLLQRPCFLKR